MPSFTIPVIAATVFTAGGYAIISARHHVEAIGDWLFTVFVVTAIGTAVAFAGQTVERHYPVTQATRDAMLRNQAVVPPGQAWAQIDGP